MTTYKVSTNAGLISAAKMAKGGDMILMASGNYGSVTMSGQSKQYFNYSSNVTIASADKNHAAVVNNMNLQFVKNMTFDGIDFDSKGGGSPFQINGSSKVTIAHSTFEGHLSGKYGTGFGLKVNKSSDIKLDSSELFHFNRGGNFIKVQNLTVTNNDVHSMAMDGLAFAQITGARIEGNYIHDTKANPTTEHKDLLQVWTDGTTVPSTNLVIRNNTFKTGDSTTQSIFMRNEAVDSHGAGKGMYYGNVLIEGNVVLSSNYHGITVGESTGLTVRGNSVIHDVSTGFNKPYYIPKVNVDNDSVNVSITGNTLHTLPAKAGSTWTVSNNKVVADGYKVGAISAPAAGTSTSSTKSAAPEQAPTAPEKAPTAPEKTGSASHTDGDLSDLTTPQSQAFYADLARDLGLTLKNGRGDGSDNFVLASGNSARAGGGDNVLVGTNARDWLYSGSGENTMAGLGGADNFIFLGSDLQGNKADTILDLDFREGDRLAFHRFERGTFESIPGGNYLDVRDGGTKVIVKSSADLKELADASRAVTLHDEGRDLVLEITQGKQVHELHFTGFDL